MIEVALETLAKQINLDKELFNTIQDFNHFENLVLNKFKELIVSMPELNIKNVEHNGTHSFPDLKVTFANNSIYGVEVKFSASGNWRSKGNSVFESLSNKEKDEKAYKEIFVFFGRKPKPKEKLYSLEVKFAPYGSSVDRIEVTHSPRFAINMSQTKSNLYSLFGHYGSYTEFRIKSNEEKNDFLREYFSKTTKETGTDKWYLPKVTNGEVLNIQPIPFKSLNESQQKMILAEAFILFPKDLFRRKADYSRVASYMISQHYVYTTSLRDCFSAGGKDIILERDIEYPKILQTFKNLNSVINKLLLDPPYDNFEEKCFLSWNESFKKDTSILIDTDIDLLTNYQRILKNLNPSMEIRNKNKNNITTVVEINLEKFYL